MSQAFLKPVLINLFVILMVFVPMDCCRSQQKPAAEKKPPTDLEIHEWGVFTAPRNAYWLKQDMLAEWSSFPEFFHGVWPRKKLAYHGPVTKPVIHFHTQEKLSVLLQIDFTTGRPLIWWPPAVYPNTGGFGVRNSLIKKGEKIDPDKSLLFDIHINKGMPNRQTIEKGHWLNHLRKVDCAEILTHGGHSMRGPGYFGEKFIYYDGIMKCPPSPSVSRVTDGILLKSELDHECLDVMVVERRGGKLFASAKLIDRIAAGKQTTRIKLVPIAGIKTLVGTLKKRIISAGLHKDEAQSLIDVWGDGLFNRGGLTVFYRIPQETYDRWLPLATKPVAKKEVRVGLVAHFRLEPELDALVKEFVKQLGSRDYRVRANADKRLREIGGPAYPAITEASKTSDPEVRLRCQKILAVRKLEKQLQSLMKRHTKRSKHQTR